MLSRFQNQNQDGFSILEMMVAVVVMVIVSTAVFSLMRDSIKVSVATFEFTDAQEGLRIAQEYINRDLMNAGDGLKSLNNIRVPQLFVTNYLTRTPVTNPSTPNIINLAILTTDNDVPAGTNVPGANPAATIRANSDRQTILEIDPNFQPVALAANAINVAGSQINISAADVTRFQVGEIYFLTSSVGGTFCTVTGINAGAAPNLLFSSGDVYGLNQPGAGGMISTITAGATLATSLMRMRIVHYYLNSNGLLMRRVFGVQGAGFRESMLAEHVLNVQFRYFLDMRNPDGTVVQPVTTLSNSTQQTAVRQVESNVTIETVHALHNNGRQQLSNTTSTSVRNMQFRQALQPSGP